ncbi:flagellar filament capping protein FliD [Hephaestia sp. GCM10023244]|uniref:flagellar filament capping protein FliD n=1 Tax=unclassified Hephaestia TaxID=2631281 RepID=UPI0020776BAB|nr:flagellar filament capping protein FliD [Hephaestia sp. MAHUQ-44]MCM8731274.1 flagellar filament capping protein FliD [Hephaestia sp. MAHUQ-44]
MTTTSATNPAASATSQILTSLNSGSGIDTPNLVSSLVAAQYAVKRDQLASRSAALTTQISDAAALLSGIQTFSSSLKTLVGSGSLSTQPTSSNSGALSVSALSGAKLAGLSASIEVRQLATAQTSAAATVADRAAPIGTGSFTLTFGTATVAGGAMTGFTAGARPSVEIAIDADHASLDGIASAINAAKAGITATIVTDASGARLMLKSATGAEQAFTLTASGASDPALAALNVGVGAAGSTIGTAAQDAVVLLDGIAVSRSTNSVDDLIAGVKIDLLAATPGAPVTIGSTRPIASLEQVVHDFVDTYNQMLALLKEDTNPISGTLARDGAARTLKTSLAALTLTPLTTGAAAGVPTTLAEIGVTTNRDGTLSVDAGRLSRALAANPDAIEAMFATGKAATGDGLPAALDAIAKAAADKKYGLAASQSTYDKALAAIADQQIRIEDQAEAMTTRLTRQFASMDARVAAYKSTQTFLEAQIAAWNKKD